MRDNSTIPEYVTTELPRYAASSAKGRKSIMVRGPWTPAISRHLNDADIKALFLNRAFDWHDVDYAFLRDIPNITQLDVLGEGPALNVEAVESLVRLECLNLDIATECAIDFGKLTALKECFIGFNPGFESIGTCKSLEELYIDEAKLQDFARLTELTNLKKLTIGNSPVKDLIWLPRLKKLRRLELLNCRTLSDFSPLSDCSQLEHLVINGCSRLQQLDFAASLTSLRSLNVSSCKDIDSFAPLRDLPELESLAFANTTSVVDGDLSPLFELKKLRRVFGFNVRKHYSHKAKSRLQGWIEFESGDLGSILFAR